MAAPFDAVLLVAFGGPQGPADVRPFLENVLRGRRVSPERVDEVAHHYERFGGVSPLTELTLGQARALESALAQRGIPLPVRVGMRNWHPYLADTLAEMSRSGVRRVIGILAAAQRSYSGCLQYRENVRDARASLIRDGLADVEVIYVGDWHEHPGFIEANADHIRQAFARLPDGRRDRARLIFTAHSIPLSMARQYPYEEQLRASAARIAHAVGNPDPPSPQNPRPGNPDPPSPQNPRPGNPDPPSPQNPRPGNPNPPSPQNPRPGNPDPPSPQNPRPGNPDPRSPRNPRPGNPDPGSPRSPRPGNPDPSSPRSPRPGNPDPSSPRQWALVYQSRSGRPGDPWLEPDICDYLKAERSAGLDAAVLCPVGFLCDHVEVLYDLDVEAADTCRESGIAMARAEAVNLHPAFIGALADAVSDVWQRYRGTRPLGL